MTDLLSEAGLVEQIQAARGNDWETAARATAALRARFPTHPLGYEVGVAAARALHRFGEAEAILAAAAPRFVDTTWLTLQQALTAQARGDGSAAERFAAALRASSPRHPAGYQIGAEAARGARRLEEAQKISAEARTRFPEEAWPLMLEARNAAARGDVEAALEFAAQARVARPNEPGGYEAATIWLRECERLSEAQTLLKAAAAHFSAAPWLNRERVALHDRQASGRIMAALANGPAPAAVAPRVAVVLGMHRAGTSLCAKIVDRLGFPLGGPLLEPSPDNPDGYQEHREINEIHKALLVRLDAAWDTCWSVRGSFDAGRLDSEGRALAAQLEAVVAAELKAHGGRFAVKDPRILSLLPLWIDIMDRLSAEPVWVLAVRDPRAVGASLRTRDRMTPERAELLWCEHYIQALRKLGPRLDAIVHYERWFTDPDAQLVTLAGVLGAPLAALAAGRAAISPDLRRESAQGPVRLALSGSLHEALAVGADLAALQRQAEALGRDLRALALQPA